MAAFNKFQPWADYMVEGANLASDQFVIALTNTEPNATDATLSQITEIAYTNLSSRNVTTDASSQTGGTYTLALDPLTLTSSSGTTGPFRYVVLYDDTVTGDPLVGWWDYGSSITLADGEELLIDFGAATITLS